MSIEMDNHECVEREQSPLIKQTIPIPECPVCLDTFDAGQHMPRMLRCGHTVCQLCLNGLLRAAGVGHWYVKCPECRSLFLARVLNELPKNYILLRALGPSNFASRRRIFPAIVLPSLWEQVCWVFNPIYLGQQLLGLLERKVLEVGKLLWVVTVMLVLLPLSLAHVVLSWWIAVLGAIIFSWISAGRTHQRWTISQYFLDIYRYAVINWLFDEKEKSKRGAGRDRGQRLNSLPQLGCTISADCQHN